MKKEIKLVDKDKKIVRITTSDERWYSKTVLNKATGLPEYVFVPSTTWIANYYPKGIGFMKWLAENGWSEAEAIKKESGEHGSRVHKAIEDLLNGKEISIDSQYPDNNGVDSELTVSEYDAIISFSDWFSETKPEKIYTELVFFADKFAGTMDFVCKIDGEYWIIDLKTSQYVWPSHEIQLTSYRQGLSFVDNKIIEPRLAVLQIGYSRNKKGFKFTEVEYQPELFEATYRIWEKECSSDKPKQKDYPLSVKL